MMVMVRGCLLLLLQQQVSEQISERTKEFIAANAGADLTRKLGGNSKLSASELALIVKSLPVSGPAARQAAKQAARACCQ
jgi:hypothetical protein